MKIERGHRSGPTLWLGEKDYDDYIRPMDFNSLQNKTDRGLAFVGGRLINRLLGV